MTLDFDKNFYESLLNDFFDGVYFTDVNRIIQYWNKGAERITGFKSDDVIGKSCSENILIHVDKEGINLCESKCPLAHTMEDRRVREADVFLHHKNGHRIPVSVRTSPLLKNDTVVGAVEVFSDNSHKSSLLELVSRLKDQVLFDELTGLASRIYIKSYIESRIKEFQEHGWDFGILFLDIDHFKKINDSFGHLAGDKALKIAADTISNNIMSYDFAGRWGGEEIITIFRNINRKMLAVKSERLRMLIAKSFFTFKEKRIAFTVSGGATMFRKADTYDSILERADILMYQSKNNGRNKITIG